MIRIHIPIAAAALVLGALALAHAPADARPESMQRDTTLSFQTGDKVRVSAWPMGASGTEICGALGRGIRGRGKTMYAQSNGGVGMPTIQRFPSVGTTPYCTRLTRTEGDSVLFTFTKLVRDSQNRLGRYTVGGYRMSQAQLLRKRVTFRWDTEGMDTVPTIVEVEPTGGGELAGAPAPPRHCEPEWMSVHPPSLSRRVHRCLNTVSSGSRWIETPTSAGSSRI